MSMHKLVGLGTLYALIGAVAIIGSGMAHAQIGGALQYPPPSVGDDAQPPPPAKMKPQPVSPRRIELGITGSSQFPMDYSYREVAPMLTISPTPPPTAGGN
jgi:hypothetical protein